MATERGLEFAARVWNWQPHSAGQREFLLCEAPEKTAACGRRWGKSESVGVDMALYALSNPGTEQFVIAPIEDQTRIMMEAISARLNRVPGLRPMIRERFSPYWEIAIFEGLTREPTRIRSRPGGTTGRGLRGRKAHRVVVDEAAFVDETIIDGVIRPMLADTDGQLIQISTPDGLNHFARSYQRGQEGDPRAQSFRFPTWENPYISAIYIDEQRQRRPEQIFAQEYEAAFLDREGAVFRRIMEAATASRDDVPGARPEYVIGVDWGRSKDFTVLVCFDTVSRRMVDFDRFNQIDFSLQRTRLAAMHTRWRSVAIIAEANSIGQPNIEALQEMGLPVIPFTTTNASKAELVDTLALAFERGDVAIFDDAILTGELMAYAAKRLPSGLMAYSAPDGQHDDCVMSLMLAVWGATRSGVQIGPDIWG